MRFKRPAPRRWVALWTCLGALLAPSMDSGAEDDETLTCLELRCSLELKSFCVVFVDEKGGPHSLVAADIGKPPLPAVEDARDHACAMTRSTSSAAPISASVRSRWPIS